MFYYTINEKALVLIRRADSNRQEIIDLKM